MTNNKTEYHSTDLDLRTMTISIKVRLGKRLRHLVLKHTFGTVSIQVRTRVRANEVFNERIYLVIFQL